MSAPELNGLVLAGGRSTRMGRDKATLVYRGQPQVDVARELLAGLCADVFVSCRPDQSDLTGALLHDAYDNIGPLAGILTAMDAHPRAPWLVLACDLPFLDRATLEFLVAHRDATKPATAFRGRIDGLPEPLCAIYEPAMRAILHQFVREGLTCPRKALIRSNTHLLELPNPFALENANRPEEAERARDAASGGIALDEAPKEMKRTCDACPPRARTIHVHLHAILREQTGHSTLALETSAHTARDVYAELARRFSLAWPAEQFRVAINDAFCPWDHPVREGDALHVIPPVAGG
ncbi:MAG TPA: NTP transferase domain-containing protein [Kiritimatiellia bacterium]|nr:NTP transferase domain-containing protein [Kiritimatiellia bacterium]